MSCTAPDGAIQFDELTVAEEVQLMLGLRTGRLEFEGTMPVAAALIELTLLGRIGSVPNRAPFTGGSPRKLVVLDQTPTGNRILDAALRPLVARDKPWVTHRCMLGVGKDVTLTLHSELERRGLVRSVGRYPNRKGFLDITDDTAYRRLRDELGRVRSRPDSVADPRTGAFIDVLRNGADSYSGEQGLQPRILWEWYPAAMRDTIHAILQAERIQFSAG